MILNSLKKALFLRNSSTFCFKCFCENKICHAISVRFVCLEHKVGFGCFMQMRPSRNNRILTVHYTTVSPVHLQSKHWLPGHRPGGALWQLRFSFCYLWSSCCVLERATSRVSRRRVWRYSPTCETTGCMCCYCPPAGLQWEHDLIKGYF